MKLKGVTWALVCAAAFFRGGGGVDVRGQDAGAQAAAIAEREAAEERYKRLNTAIEDLLAAQAAQHKRIQALTDEIRTLREDMTRRQPDYATHEDLRRLAQKAQEIDDKREADRKLILEELQKLLKAPPAVATPPATGAGAGAGGASGGKPGGTGMAIEKGYEHTVEAGQSLSLIIQAYREKGVKVTQKQVLDANQGLNPNRLTVGQKIFIPDASK